MNQRIFPSLDQTVSEIGLGTWQLGGTEWGAVDDEQALATLRTAANRGVTFFDTADIYGAGRSEQLLGRFLREQGERERFFVATKLGRRSDPGWPANFTPATIIQHTEDSLRRLGLERIDLTQTHCIPPAHLENGEVWESLRELQRAGKVRSFGASVESVQEGLDCLSVEGLSSLQIIFNVFRQRPLDELLSAAAQRGVAIIVRLPLASGLLCGRYTNESRFEPSDHRNFNRDGQKFNVGETFAGLPFEVGVQLVDELRAHVGNDLSMAQWALRWCLDCPQVTTVIPGAKRPGQVEENASASDCPPISMEIHDWLRNWYRRRVADQIRGKY